MRADDRRTAKLLCPVDTGLLRSSITHAISSYEVKEDQYRGFKKSAVLVLFYLNSGEKADRGGAGYRDSAVFAKGRIG